MRIDRVAQPIDSPVARKIDMRNLPQRMHAGVGAARAMDDGAHAAIDGGHGLFEALLHRNAIRLPLPADVRRTVIFDRQREAGHGGMSEPVSNLWFFMSGTRSPFTRAALANAKRPRQIVRRSRSLDRPQIG